jgi:hypothetical protein
MKRGAKNLTLALLMAFVFVVSGTELIAQSPQTSGSDKSQAPAATSSASAAAKPTPSASPSTNSAPPANAAGVVWINTDTGVYHKQGTRWYGKTKHGKYMLEADAIKAGYKPAK